MLLDNIVTNAVTALARLTPSRNLCLAGGVALNSVSNERAFRRSRFQNLYVMPNAGDCGQALGCALYGAHVLRRDRKSRGLLSDSLGPPYTDSEVVAALRAANLEPVVVPILRRQWLAYSPLDSSWDGSRAALNTALVR